MQRGGEGRHSNERGARGGRVNNGGHGRGQYNDRRQESSPVTDRGGKREPFYNRGGGAGRFNNRRGRPSRFNNRGQGPGRFNNRAQASRLENDRRQMPAPEVADCRASDTELRGQDEPGRAAPYTPYDKEEIERGGEVPQMTPAQIAEKARQDQIDAAERKRITETVNIGKPGCAGTEPTRAGGSLEGQRQRNDGLYIGEVTDIAGMQSAQEWEKNTILIWRKQMEDQRCESSVEINPINENMHEFQLNRYRPFTIETIVKMYDDILDFENKDFIEGQWRSFIEFVQYTAPFYITYHFFPKIFHKIGAMAKSFVDAEAGNVKGLVDGIVEKTISGPPPCPFIPQVQEAVRMAIEAKGGVFQDRHTPRTQSAPPDESNTRASPKMLSLLDEPVPEIKFYSVLSLESGGRGSLNAVNAPTKVNKGVLTGDVVPFVPAKMKQSIADVGLIGSRWAVSEEADVTEMGLGQSRFARPATKGPGNKMSRGIYTGDTGNVGSTATQDVEFKRQTKW